VLEVGSWRPFSTAVVAGEKGCRWRACGLLFLAGRGGGGDSEIRACFFFWLSSWCCSWCHRFFVEFHGGGSWYSCWSIGGVWFDFNWDLISRWPIGGLLRHPTGPKGCRAAASPLQWLCLMDLSALCSKWCVPGGAVADHPQDRHRSGGGRGCT
jgi:hypothetical protein